jgi:PAS domain S-box-containing protein
MIDISQPNYFHAIIQNHPHLICVYNLGKKIEFMNHTVNNIVGQQPDYYVGKSIHDFGYEPEFLEKFEAGFDKCVAEAIPTIIETTVFVARQKMMSFLINFVPIFDNITNLKEVVGVFSVSHDITKQKILELEKDKRIEELNILSQRIISKANKLQNFSYIISHNLRSPVSNIMGLITLYDDTQDITEKEEFMQMLKVSADRLSQTIHDLTEAIKISQNIELLLENLYFEDILTHIKESIGVYLMETDTKIEIDFSNCPTIVYHKVYLESILLNLITNAIKYRHPLRKPIIQLKTSITDNNLILACIDNGLGIDLEKHGHKIFGLHKTFHNNQDARGVGLFITKNQIEALGGSIQVESNVNKGTKFIINFNNYVSNESN